MSKWEEVPRFALQPNQWGKFDGMVNSDDGAWIVKEDYDALLAHCKSLEAAQQRKLPERGTCDNYGTINHLRTGGCINWRPTAVTEESKSPYLNKTDFLTHL